MDIPTLAAARKYANDLIQGVAGQIVKGKNCQIQSITPTANNSNIVTFAWYRDDGSAVTSTLEVKNGNDGTSITNVSVNTNNHLIVTYSDGATSDAGLIPTVKGDKGDDGKSAYEVAVDNGFVGTIAEWLDSLIGEDGKSAYDIAVEQGYTGTEEEWVKSLEGFSPEITVAQSTEEVYKLKIKTADDEFVTPNLKGGGGSGGGSSIDDDNISTDTTYSSFKINKELEKAGKVKSVNGMDGEVTLTKDDIDLDQVDNTSDADKPISDAQKTVNDDFEDRITTLEDTDTVLQLKTMGLASDYPQKIVQYIGADGTSYEKGYFYYSQPSVVSGEVIYTWTQIDVEPSSRNYNDLENLPTINNIEVKGDKSLADYGIQGIMQYAEFPEPTIALAGRIAQFTGSTSENARNGYFYQVQYDAESASYKWKEINVSDNTALKSRIATLETNQGDMSALEIPSASDLVSALNALNLKDLKSIVYTEPNLVLTYKDDSTFTYDIGNILRETSIGELNNVLDENIQDGNILQYDTSISRYKPYDISTALTTLLQTSKDYTDTRISASMVDDALVCDDKPTLTTVDDKYVVVYYQDTVVHTTDKTDTRFYYYNPDGIPQCTSYIDGTEFTYTVSDANFDDFVSKTNDLTNTYTEDFVDKTKVPTISALDALLTIVKEALALKVNTDDIVDNLNSNDPEKVLSAKQGKEIKALLDAKQDIIQYTEMPLASVHQSRVCQFTGVSSNAYQKGFFYVSVYDNDNDTWYWKEIKYGAETDTTITEDGVNPVTGGAIYTALQDKQNKTLDAPIEVDGTEYNTVEETLNALNEKTVTVDTTLDTESNNPIANSTVATALNSKQNTIQYEDIPNNPTDGMLIQYIGATTSDFITAHWYTYNATEEKWEETDVQTSSTLDPSPTENSTNGVTSGGVYSALNNIATDITLDQVVYAAVTVKKGTFKNPEIGGLSHAVQSIQFDVAMPEGADYEVNLTEVTASDAHFDIQITNKTTTGFDVVWYRDIDGTLEAETVEMAYTAFVLNTVTDYESKQTKVLETPIEIDGEEVTTVQEALEGLNNKTVEVDENLSNVSENPVQNKTVNSALNNRLTITDALATPSSEIVGQVRLLTAEQTGYTIGGIYKCQESATAGTYEWVLISTAEVDLSQYKKQFNGTLAEWDALTDEQKAEFDSAAVVDNAGFGTIITGVVEDGNENPVSSAGVYKSLPKVTSGTGTLLNGATGDVTWYKYGRICVVRVHNLVFNTTSINTQIIKGLPAALADVYSTVSAHLNNGTGSYGQLHILKGSDTIDTGWGATNATAQFTGELVYITTE